MSDLTAELRTLLESGGRPTRLRIFTLACMHDRALVECFRVPDEPALVVYRDALLPAGYDVLDPPPDADFEAPFPRMRGGGPRRVIHLDMWVKAEPPRFWLPAGTRNNCCLAEVESEFITRPMDKGKARETYWPGRRSW